MASLTETPYYFPGDLVTYGASPQVYRVVKMKQVNILAEAENGSKYNLRIVGVKKCGPGAVFNPAPKAPVVPTEVIHLGDTVRFTGRDAVRFPGVYVVGTFTTGDRAKYVKLNGGTNSSVTGSRSAVTKVELSEF